MHETYLIFIPVPLTLDISINTMNSQSQRYLGRYSFFSLSIDCFIVFVSSCSWHRFYKHIHWRACSSLWFTSNSQVTHMRHLHQSQVLYRELWFHYILYINIQFVTWSTSIFNKLLNWNSGVGEPLWLGCVCVRARARCWIGHPGDPSPQNEYSTSPVGTGKSVQVSSDCLASMSWSWHKRHCF